MKPIRIPDWFTGVTSGAWLNLDHVRIGIMAAGFVLFPLSEVSAQLVCSPNWTAAYKCMEHCGPCPGGGGYVAPQQRSDDINSAGVQASNAGNWALAASLFQQALQINPNNPAAAINLRRTQAIMVNEDGMKAVNARNWSLAESLFEQASRINPNDPAIASNLLKVRTLIQGLADQRATEEQNNAARDQINSQALAEAEAKRKAASDVINSQVLAEAEAKRKAASDVINSQVLAEAEAKRKAASELINSASAKDLLQPSKQLKVRAEIQGLQEALKILNHSINSDADERQEWEAKSAGALRDSYALAANATLEILVDRADRQIDAEDAELRRANDLLHGEKDPNRREQLHDAYQALTDRKEELIQTKERIEKAHDAVDILNTTQNLAYGEKQEESKTQIEAAWDACDKLNLLPKGASQAKALVDASYDVTVQIFSVQRINALNANAESYLKAVDALSKRMKTLVDLKRAQAGDN